MVDAPILIVGGGPAGVSAALALAEAGQKVLLVEQRDKLGGAIHRQPAHPGGLSLPRLARHVRNWNGLMKRLEAARGCLELRVSTIFLGIDGTGNVLLDERRKGRVVSLRARGAIIALGAVERVHPFPGWELPGVITAGGAQVLLKETGRPPDGAILVAGSGPLPFALAAQLASAGNAPIAVLERSQPWHQLRALITTSLFPSHLWEGMAYGMRLAASRVPYLTGSEIMSVQEDDGGLAARVRHRNDERVYRVRHLIVHDGLLPNNLGVPTENSSGNMPVLLAGDAREVLGADAAIVDGRRVAAEMAEQLNLGRRIAVAKETLGDARRFQSALAQLYRASRSMPPDETILCRCESLRLNDLKALPPGSSSREIRLVGRFGMGACQGRFCHPNVADLKIGGLPAPSAAPPLRWPLRPVSVAALARLHDVSSDPSEL